MGKLPDDLPDDDKFLFLTHLEWARTPEYARFREALKPVEDAVMAELIAEGEAAVATGGDPTILLDPEKLRTKQMVRVNDLLHERAAARGKPRPRAKVVDMPQPAKPRRKRSAQR